VGATLGLEAHTIVTNGHQPVGRGIGPALEARDVLAVLRGEPGAPEDLRDRAVMLAGRLLEISGKFADEQGAAAARTVLNDGRAWKKFLAICEAQGGFREPPRAEYTHEVYSPREGRVSDVDNRRLARVAKLAGAPKAPSAGLEIHVRLGQAVSLGQPLYTIHAETAGELEYAMRYVRTNTDIIHVQEFPL
jgi:thymidine phosphorylase